MSLKAVACLTCLSLLGAGSSLTASQQGPGPSRRLVILLDGTLNNPEQSVDTRGNHKLYKPTAWLLINDQAYRPQNLLRYLAPPPGS